MAKTVERLDQGSVRRIAYRLSGTALALYAMHIEIRGLSIEELDSGDGDSEAFILFDGFNRERDHAAFAYIVGECAADFSGEPGGLELPNPPVPDLSSVEAWCDEITQFALRAAGPITGLAEALLARKRLSESQFCQIVGTEITRRRV